MKILVPFQVLLLLDVFNTTTTTALLSLMILKSTKVIFIDITTREQLLTIMYLFSYLG